MHNILIIKPSSFGDIIQALPVAARLREEWPRARISWLVNTQYRRLLEKNPCVDSLFLFSRDLWRKQRNLPAALSSFRRLWRDLSRARFDAVIDLQGLLRSGMLTLATGAPVRAGFANAREGAHLCYNRRVAVVPEEMHAVERYLLAAAALGCRGTAVTFPLGMGKEEEAWAAQFLRGATPDPGGLTVGLSPAARWSTKRWPIELFALLGDRLAARGARVVLIGGLGGEGKAVADRMRAAALVADGIDDPLKTAALVKRCAVLVSNDSGPMHLAAAVGTPVVALFGPTEPARTGPYGRRHAIVCATVDCRPCYRKECPRGEECMRLIGMDRVFEAARKIIEAQ